MRRRPRRSPSSGPVACRQHLAPSGSSTSSLRLPTAHAASGTRCPSYGAHAIELAGIYLVPVCLQQLVQALSRFLDAQMTTSSKAGDAAHHEKVSLTRTSPFESPPSTIGWSYSDRGCLSADGSRHRLAAGAQSASPSFACFFSWRGTIRRSSRARRHSRAQRVLAAATAGEELVWMAEVARCGVVSRLRRVLLTARSRGSAPVWLLGPILARHREHSEN